jgi:hypothetical protein
VSIIPTDSGQQQTQGKREFLNSAAPWAETFSKAVAGIAIALYASGFLAVSLYHSQFGFVGTNPFRPRVLAAGAWFFFFTSIPVSIATGFRADSWRKIGKNAATLWIACISLSVLLGNLLFDYTTDSRPFIHLPTWGWIATAVVWVSLVAATAPASFKLPEWAAITASVLLTSLYLVNPLVSFFRHQFDTLCLGLWFFGVAIVALTEFKTRNWENVSSFGGWAKPMGVLLAALLLFSQYVYPHLKTSWGGGTPANVTVYFTRDSLLNPNKAVQAQLIEESDEGFYIVGPKESKAVFVPRSAVALVYFSDKPAESPMLQGNKPLAP